MGTDAVGGNTVEDTVMTRVIVGMVDVAASTVGGSNDIPWT